DRDETLRTYFPPVRRKVGGNLHSGFSHWPCQDFAKWHKVKVGNQWLKVSEVEAGHKYDVSVWANYVGKYLPGGKNHSIAKAFRKDKANYFLQKAEGQGCNRSTGASNSMKFPDQPDPKPNGAPRAALQKWNDYKKQRDAELRQL